MNIISGREQPPNILLNNKYKIEMYLVCTVSYDRKDVINENFIYLEKNWYRENYDGRIRKYHITKVYGESFNKLEEYRKNKLYCIYLSFWKLRQYLYLDVLREIYHLTDLIHKNELNKQNM